MILETLAEYCASLRRGSLAPDVVHAAKRSVVDWFAAALAGADLPPATLLREALREETGSGSALVLPSGTRAGLRAAALINGAASHTVELDDIYRDGLFHPGAPVISAALAAAQARGASGKAFLRGVVAGYEISTRIATAVGPTHYEYWHTTGTVGTFGAAAAAATIFGLEKDRALNALANAGTLAAGLQQAFRSSTMSKPLHAGRAAESGIMVALAAETGVTGAVDILEGPRGFGRAMSDKPDWSEAVQDLGTSFNIKKTTIKNHAACGHAHAAIDAMIALRTHHGLKTSNVKRVSVGTYAKALEVAGNTEPRTAFEAKFSLPYCVSVALTAGNVRLEAFAEERLDDPELREIMTRVELHVDADAEAAYPERRMAVVDVETTDGRHLSHRADTRKGDPDDPLSDAELNEKFRELVEPVVGHEAGEELLAALWQIDELDDITSLPIVSGASGP
jgi:2-methylcitrate dehydratase PrpD